MKTFCYTYSFRYAYSYVWKVHRSRSFTTQRDLLKEPHWSETWYGVQTTDCSLSYARRVPPSSFLSSSRRRDSKVAGRSVSVGRRDQRGLMLKEIVRGIFAHVFLLTRCSSTFFYIISITYTQRVITFRVRFIDGQ